MLHNNCFNYFIFMIVGLLKLRLIAQPSLNLLPDLKVFSWLGPYYAHIKWQIFKKNIELSLAEHNICDDMKVRNQFLH